jgi:hypothetical protein
MHRRSWMFQLVALAAFGSATAAFAQDVTSPQAPGGNPTDPAAAAVPTAPPAAAAPDAVAPSDAVAPGAEPGIAEAGVKPRDLSAPMYGAGARWRWVTVPGWFLNLFSQKNVPLYTFSCFGLEGFRRKVDKDDPSRTWELVVGLGYQNMSPPDGYWLGKGKDPAQDADMVQARNLSFITMDAAFVSRQYFGPYFGIHYGAGLGLAVVRGKVLRTSARYDPGTGQYEVRDRGGVQMCKPDATCNEGLLNQSELNPPDNGPGDPHRFQETAVPGALPIINLLVGIDARIPIEKYHQAVEFRLEGGFFDAFFIGMAVSYQM